jgi:hypothetical protein
MATSALPVVGIAMLALTACDLSQRKPETIRAVLPHGAAMHEAPRPIGSIPLPPAHANVHAPYAREGNAVGVEGAVGERSIRLYGPGVSRKRQIRV